MSLIDQLLWFSLKVLPLGKELLSSSEHVAKKVWAVNFWVSELGVINEVEVLDEVEVFLFAHLVFILGEVSVG